MRANRSGHLDALVRAFTLYEIILSQFSKGAFYKISDENIKHDYEINIKKQNKPNMSRRIIPEHFHYGDDDDDNQPRPPDESLGDEERARDSAKSLLSGIYNKVDEERTREDAKKY